MAKLIIDEGNQPQIVKIGTKSANVMWQLPLDVIIHLNGKKVIAECKILDGVMVYEKILREPWKIEFEFTVRELQGQQGQEQHREGRGKRGDIFASLDLTPAQKDQIKKILYE